MDRIKLTMTDTDMFDRLKTSHNGAYFSGFRAIPIHIAPYWHII